MDYRALDFLTRNRYTNAVVFMVKGYADTYTKKTFFTGFVEINHKCPFMKFAEKQK